MRLRARSIDVPHGRLSPPVFMPDATYGAVRSVDSKDLVGCGVQAVVMNVFHLMRNPGSTVIKGLGGLHRLAGWGRPIVTDSGGFQIYSLIRRDPKLGSITERGMSFRPSKNSRRFLLTPEKSIQLQLSYGADIAICLDDCTHVDEPLSIQRESVDRTIRWAARCKEEYERRIGRYEGSRPLLYAVVQGGGSRALRRSCAEELLELGFDGYGFGGYPLDSSGKLLAGILNYTRRLIPPEYPIIALGVGEPGNVAHCLEMGYNLFDSSLPTRDARQGRLYAFGEGVSRGDLRKGEGYNYVYIGDEEHVRDGGPISPVCDCPACIEYSRAYLHHLQGMGDHLYHRLATMHNLRFMTLLLERLVRSRDDPE
jgi:queuine tRNA-ribosyltransferase